jgi:flagellar biosynthesis/type III secretory pathway protein FliH
MPAAKISWCINMQPFEFYAFEENKPRKAREQKFSLADVEAAKHVARQEGYGEGAKAAADQARTEAVLREQSLNEVTRVLAAQCASLLGAYQEYMAQHIPAMTRLATQIARKVCRHALEHAPLKEIEGMVQETAPLLMSQPEIHITVHASLAAPLQDRIYRVLNADPKKVAIKISGEAGLGMQDCRISWKDGDAARDTQKLWQQVENLLEAHVGKMPLAEAEALMLSSKPLSHISNQ